MFVQKFDFPDIMEENLIEAYPFTQVQSPAPRQLFFRRVKYSSYGSYANAITYATTTKFGIYLRRRKACFFRPAIRCSSSATWPTAQDWAAKNTRRPLRHPPHRSWAFYTRVRKPSDCPKTRNRWHSWALKRRTINVK